MYKHRFDPVSFVFGLAFVAVALLFVIPEDPWEIYFGGVSLGWLWPLLVIAAGVALLAPLVRRTETDPAVETTEQSEDGDDDEDLPPEAIAEALEELGEPPA